MASGRVAEDAWTHVACERWVNASHARLLATSITGAVAQAGKAIRSLLCRAIQIPHHRGRSSGVAQLARGSDGAGQVGAMADFGLDTCDKATIFADFKGRIRSGYALVARQYLINGKNTVTPSATLIHTAYDIFPGGFGSVGKERGQEILTMRPSTDAGFGRVDINAATSMSDAQLFGEKPGVGVGETRSCRASKVIAGILTATLAWIDAPVADSAAKALVNDLDLSVIDSTGRETALRDSTNNTEMIEIPVTAGAYEIRVKGTNVQQGIRGKQPYALIVGIKAASP